MQISDKHLEGLLEKIRVQRNIDFRSYKRATLRRRTERRLTERRCLDVASYVALLDREPQELDTLISSMFIKVTRFFRDDDIWKFIADHTVPEIITSKRGKQSLRIWCAGCATGEEAFSIAILIAEALGPSLGSWDIKIFGTDVDESAVAFARRATYSPSQLEGVSKEILERWFYTAPEGYAVRKEIRRLVVFGVNNLVSDAPISRLDLILCRNVFIYLDAEMQKRVILRFHYALRRDGVLALGKSELIPFAAKLFRPVDLPRRIYSKDGRREADLDLHSLALEVPSEHLITSAPEMPPDDTSYVWRYYRDILDALQAPAVATGVNGDVKFWGGAAARIWGLTDKEVLGKKLSALGLAGMSGDLLIEKTAAVRDGRRDREAADGLIPVLGAADPMIASVEVSCLRNAAKQVIGLLYVVHDVTALRTLERDMRRMNEELKVANEKLQVANEELQATNEELETTNEELQSANEELQTTNEELQTTNEELQSANEELETTNEELQSTNVELDATNRELAHRTEEMNLLGFYHRTIIRSLSAAIVILDSEGRVTLWNIAAERLLGLAEAEALGQILWTLRVPALPRSLVLRIRNLLREDRPFRADNVEYDLPTGGRGYANLAALPLLDGKSRMGAAMIFEDITRFVRFAERRLRSQGKGGGREKEWAAKGDADGSQKGSEKAPAKRLPARGKTAKARPATAPAKAGSGKRQLKAVKDGTRAAKAQSVKGGRGRRTIGAGANGAGRTMDTEIALIERGESGRGGGDQ